jgi:hypothetical protein
MGFYEKDSKQQFKILPGFPTEKTENGEEKTSLIYFGFCPNAINA